MLLAFVATQLPLCKRCVGNDIERGQNGVKVKQRESRQPVRIAMLLLGKLDFHIYLHARFRNDSCAKCSLCGSSWKRKTCNILPELLLCINILISQLVKCQFSIWIFTIFTSQIYSHKFDNVLQIRIAWIVPQSVAIKSQIWSMLLMWPAQARRRNWSHVPGKCNTDTHAHTHPPAYRNHTHSMYSLRLLADRSYAVHHARPSSKSTTRRMIAICSNYGPKQRTNYVRILIINVC